MVDQAFRATLRNFSTLFLLVAVVTVPLHVAYSVVFANVIETRELHDVIETFPEARQVRGVGKSRLNQARVGLALVTLIELASIPFLARGTRRVLQREAENALPTVRDGLRAMREGSVPLPGAGRAGPVIVALVVGAAFAIMIERIGLLALEFVSDARSFPFFGLMQGVARAAGAPFFLVTLVMSGRGKPAEETPDLY